jgi:hypothetical protein
MEVPGLPPGMQELLGQLLGGDPADMLRPAGAALAGLQAGQVIGQLAQQLSGAYDLGIPTAPRAEAHLIAVNIHEAFEGYDLDPTEVAVALALTEGAHRRLYHAVPWLEAHVASLVARFAAGTVVDEDRLREIADEVMLGVDPEDPESLRAAMERAAGFRRQIQRSLDFGRIGEGCCRERPLTSHLGAGVRSEEGTDSVPLDPASPDSAYLHLRLTRSHPSGWECRRYRPD